eukprot:768713-Hanusia_phi.AAC.2
MPLNASLPEEAIGLSLSGLIQQRDEEEKSFPPAAGRPMNRMALTCPHGVNSILQAERCQNTFSKCMDTLET